jgi:hypothetical protein
MRKIKAKHVDPGLYQSQELLIAFAGRSYRGYDLGSFVGVQFSGFVIKTAV